MHASTLHKASTVDKRSAHRMMCHSSRTAENYYMINDLGDITVHGHTVLSQNIGLKDTIKTGTPETTKANQPSQRENKPSPQSGSSPPPSSKGLSTAQLDDIDLLFSNVIATYAPFSVGDAKNGMSKSINVVGFVGDHEMVMKMYKRVKSQSPLNPLWPTPTTVKPQRRIYLRIIVTVLPKQMNRHPLWWRTPTIAKTLRTRMIQRAFDSISKPNSQQMTDTGGYLNFPSTLTFQIMVGRRRITSFNMHHKCGASGKNWI